MWKNKKPIPQSLKNAVISRSDFLNEYYIQPTQEEMTKQNEHFKHYWHTKKIVLLNMIPLTTDQVSHRLKAKECQIMQKDTEQQLKK